MKQSSIYKETKASTNKILENLQHSERSISIKCLAHTLGNKEMHSLAFQDNNNGEDQENKSNIYLISQGE